MMEFITLPSKEDIENLPPIHGLDFNHIYFIQHQKELQQYLAKFEGLTTIGFDTESKPCFRKGEKNFGPHLIQLATEQDAFVFSLRDENIIAFLKTILENPQISKVGFGLRDDARLLKSNYKIELVNAISIDNEMKKLGYKNPVGMHTTIAVLLQQKMSKPKSIRVSNWAKCPLNDRQLHYAANDAYFSLLSYQHFMEKIKTS